MAGQRPKRDPIRQYLSDIGRRGGEKKVPKGAAALSPEERRARAAKMSAERWAKYYREHPEKLKAKQEKKARQKMRGKSVA